MFFGPLAETNFPIVVPDIEPEVFQEMLSFMATSQARIPSIKFGCELHYAATKYMLPYLIQTCVGHISFVLEPENACFVLDYANLVGDDYLVGQCVSVIQENTTRILVENSLENIPFETMIFIYSMEQLAVFSEAQLYIAAVRYARARDRMEAPKEQEVSIGEIKEEDQPPSTSKYHSVPQEDSENNNSEDSTSQSPENSPEPNKERKNIEYRGRWIGNGPSLTSPIRQLLHRIRFLAMTPQQFADCHTLSALLTPSEIYAILMNVSSTNSQVAMPEGFSTDRNQRTEMRIHTSLLYLSATKLEAVRHRTNVTKIFTINYFNALEHYESPRFYVANMPWRLIARPEYVRMGNYEAKYLSFLVQCTWDSSEPWSRHVGVVITLLPQNDTRPRYRHVQPYKRTFTNVFSKESPTHGIPMFGVWDDISTLGYLRHDTLVVQILVYQDFTLAAISADFHASSPSDWRWSESS